MATETMNTALLFVIGVFIVLAVTAIVVPGAARSLTAAMLMIQSLVNIPLGKFMTAIPVAFR